MQITSFLHCIIHHLQPWAVPHVSTWSQKGMIFAKRLANVTCVHWFYLQLLSKTFLILRRIQWDITINVHKSSCKVPVILTRHQISWKFSGNRVVPCGRIEKDGQDEANSHSAQCFKCTYHCHYYKKDTEFSWKLNKRCSKFCCSISTYILKLYSQNEINLSLGST
jgi:hypothetical protein